MRKNSMKNYEMKETELKVLREPKFTQSWRKIVLTFKSHFNILKTDMQHLSATAIREPYLFDV